MLRDQLEIALDQVLVRCIRQALVTDEAVIDSARRGQRHILGEYRGGYRIGDEVRIKIKPVAGYRLVRHRIADKKFPTVVCV